MKKGENMKLPIILTRRVLIAGATLLSMAMTPLSAMADDVKVAGIFTLPVDQQWISRIHIALDAAQERGDIEYVYSENVSNSDYERVMREYAESGVNLIVGEVFGLGIAKTTFALNLSFPMEAEVCCLDIHLLRFLGYIGESPSVTDYKRLENEWLIRCEKYGVSASVSREIYWNKVQNRRNSRYWSYCIEK